MILAALASGGTGTLTGTLVARPAGTPVATIISVAVSLAILVVVVAWTYSFLKEDGIEFGPEDNKRIFRMRRRDELKPEYEKKLTQIAESQHRTRANMLEVLIDQAYSQSQFGANKPELTSNMQHN